MRARKIHGRDRREKKEGGKWYNYLKEIKNYFLKRKKCADLPPKKKELLEIQNPHIKSNPK